MAVVDWWLSAGLPEETSTGILASGNVGTGKEEERERGEIERERGWQPGSERGEREAQGLGTGRVEDSRVKLGFRPYCLRVKINYLKKK